MRLRAKRPAKRLVVLFAATVFALCAFAGAGASASSITGISDENLSGWGAQASTLFTLTGVGQARFITPYNTVDIPSRLEKARAWISAAEARGLKVLVSFDHAPLCEVGQKNCTEPTIPYGPVYTEKVKAFRADFPEITEYTAWNEPNHKINQANPSDSTICEPSTTVCGAAAAASYWNLLSEACKVPSSTGQTCTVAGGDFLDESSLESYMKTYRTNMYSAPPEWALHPYGTVDKESTAVLTKFISLDEGRPVWFSEVGVYYCSRAKLEGASEEEALAYQNGRAAYLNSILSQYSVARTYYYFLAAEHGGQEACPGFDTALLSSGDKPRPAFATLFPRALDSASSSTWGLRDAVSAKQWLYFPNTAGNVAELYWSGSSWTDGPFAATIRASTTPSVIQNSKTGEKWVYYTNTSGGISELYWNGSTWTSGSFAVSVAAGATSPTVIIDLVTGEKWIYYVNSSNGISELYWNGSSWTGGTLGGSVAPGTSPTVLRNPATGEKFVYYIDTSGTISEYYWSGSSWSYHDLGGSASSTGNAPAGVINTVSGPVSREQWIYYVNTSGGISELYWNGSSWTNGSLGGSVRAGTGPTVARNLATGEKWIYYINSSNAIAEFFWSGSAWGSFNIGGTVSSKATSPTVLLNPSNNEQFVDYLNSSGGVSEWVYTTGWNNYTLP